MSAWKKIITIFLIINLLGVSVFPLTALANGGGGIGSTSTSGSSSCPIGQQLDITGQNCIPVTSQTTPVTSSSSGPCANLTGNTLTQCQNAAAASGTLRQFNPNVNISNGNTYGGLSISGVGGAIASCTNVGGFLVSSAVNLLGSGAISKKVKAAFGFTGGGNAVATSDSKAQQQLQTQTKISQCLNGVAYAVAKNTLAQVTRKTLNWVNTGLSGNPLYVQNIGSYLSSIKNQQVQGFLQTVVKSDPIFGNALRSSITFQITGKSDGLLNVSLNTPQARSYNAFMGDFTNGGWDALLNPAYNPLSAFYKAVDTLSTSEATQQQNTQNQIQRNNGFLDLTHCTQWANNGQVSAVAANGSIVNVSTQKGAGLTYQPVCTQQVTDTPGSIIASQVSTITTTPIRQLEYANQINQVLGNFFDSFVNNLLSKGLRGSNGNSQPVNFGLSSEGDNSVANSSGTADTSGLGYQSANGQGTVSGDFDISRPQQLRAILQTQYNFLNRTEDAQIALERVIPTIGALDYCIPGPNPDWQTGFDGNWQTFAGSIQQADPRNASTLEKIVDSLPVVGSLVGEITSLFTGSGTPPPVWTADSILSDKVTGQSLQLQREFFAPNGHADNIKTPDLLNALNLAYGDLTNRLSYYQTSNNTFVGSNVGNAFEQAAITHPNDSLDVDGFLQDAYTQTDSIVGYNQAATQIDQQYDQNISDTQNDIEQLKDISQKENAIVATAKARYIAQRAAAGDPVNMQCIDQAYQIDNSPITPVARQEPNSNPLSLEEDQIEAHSIDSSNRFYNNTIK
jgi:hypothetical protein